MSLSFVLSPKSFSMLLKNVLEFAAGNISSNPNILIHAERDGRAGTVSATSAGTALAARDWSATAGVDGDDVAQVLVLAKAKDKSDLVDDLTKLAAAIGKTSTAKSAQVFVEIHNRRSITVEYGGQLVGELADTGASTAQLVGAEDLLDRDDWSEAPGPTAFMTETLKALTKIKTPTGTTVVDVAQLPSDHRFIGVAMGPTFRGLVACVDRASYAKGGPWSDGPGTPDQLLGGEA